MPFEPQTWSAERYLGRAEGGRTRPLRLACSRQSDDTRETAEFFAKFVGLPEVVEKSLFAEMLGNVLARASGITTGQPAFIGIDDVFADFLRHVDVHVKPGIGVGSRSLGAGLGPATFGRMSQDQLLDAARLYLFDLFTQNPDRGVKNPNCLVVARRLVAIDFADCFSFLYPILGVPAHPWEVSKLGIASRHVFHGELRRTEMDWRTLVQETLLAARGALAECEVWLPDEWEDWARSVQDHFAILSEHEQELVFELAGSLS